MRRHMSRPILATVGLVFLAGVLVWPSLSSAYVIGGTRWPGATIRIHDASGYGWSIYQAVRAWNTSGSRIRFIYVPRAQAQVLIARSRLRAAAGRADMGYIPGHRSRVWLAAGLDRFTMAQVAAHELGHVLGLDHEDRLCATMNSGWYARCGTLFDGQWRCRLLELDDVRGAIRLYGGRPRPLRTPPVCYELSLPAPPSEVSIVLAPEWGVSARITWRNATSKNLADVDIRRGRDVCPRRPSEGEGQIGSASSILPGQLASADDYDELEPGRYCYALWSLDDFGRRSKRALLAWLDVTP